MKVKLGSTKSKYYQNVEFDDVDMVLLFNYRWNIVKRGRGLYAFSKSGGKPIYMHQLILPAPKGKMVDHINGNGLDNRRENLRICVQAENLRNRPPITGKKYKGIYHVTRGKTTLKKPWAARIHTAEFGAKHLGYFATEIEAALAYNKAAFKYFKDFAWLNPIEQDGKIVYGIEVED